MATGLFPSREQLNADALWFTRREHAANAVLVQAFTVIQVTDPDEPVPYYLDARAMTVPCPAAPDQP